MGTQNGQYPAVVTAEKIASQSMSYITTLSDTAIWSCCQSALPTDSLVDYPKYKFYKIV